MLHELLYRAVREPEIRELLLTQPERAGDRYQLSQQEVAALKTITSREFEAAVGRLFSYRLVPYLVGGRLAVIPRGSANCPEGRLPIYLDQNTTGTSVDDRGRATKRGHAFGSGAHPTTRLCLELLEEILQPGICVLDLGTGSGILALAAARLGASVVLALDVDPDAVDIARENCTLNQLEEIIEIRTGGVDSLHGEDQPFNLITANILLSVHRKTIEEGLLNWAAPDGRLLLSGFSLSREKRLGSMLEDRGWYREQYRQAGSWVAVVYRQLQNLHPGG